MREPGYCPCLCHDPATPEGVDVRDPIEAVLACRDCLNDHTPALADDPPSRPLPRGDTSTAWVDVDPDGKAE
jgi:hypothetical protein